MNEGTPTVGENPEPTMQCQTVVVAGQPLHVAVRPGRRDTAPPLLLCNGVGANLELLAPFVDALDGIETIAFDLPGVGGSPPPRIPLRFWGLAWLMARLLDRLGYREVDVLGVSWGGALAQQFALQYSHRCRKLILAATSASALMVPGRPSVIAKVANPRRYREPSYLAAIAPEIYGGAYRRHPELAQDHARHTRPPTRRGYYFQLLALIGWTSLPWLPLLRQPTLVLAGSDDPLVPLINAKILVRCIRNAQLHVVDDGHFFLATRATEVTPVVRQFLAREAERIPKSLSSRVHD